MFCSKCGKEIPDESKVCPNCNMVISNEMSSEFVVYASQKEPLQNTEIKQKKKIPKRLIMILSISLSIIIIAVISFIVVLEISKANLKKDLVRDWKALDESIIKVLDISDDTIDYRLETGYAWMDTSVAKYDWKPVSGNQIEITRFGDHKEVFTVEFNKDKTTLTISPAITSSDKKETWYYID